MKLSQFKFKLPEDKIALHPTKYRDESRLMVLHRRTGEIEHKMFKDVLNYFDDKDVFIFNDTKVFPARLYGNKEKTGARIEVFLLRELNEELRLWDVLVVVEHGAYHKTFFQNLSPTCYRHTTYISCVYHTIERPIYFVCRIRSLICII